MTVERASEGLAQMRISADSPRTAASKPPTPVRLTVADVASSLPTKPCVDFVDARVNDAPGPVRFVAFRNHYASSVTVKVKLATKVPVKTPAGTLQNAGESRWVTALRDVRAMEDCHHEDDAQALNALELPRVSPDGIALNGIVAIRVYASNPSPRWATERVRVKRLVAFRDGTERSVRAAVLAASSSSSSSSTTRRGAARAPSTPEKEDSTTTSATSKDLDDMDPEDGIALACKDARGAMRRAFERRAASEGASATREVGRAVFGAARDDVVLVE
jgi:hypothetical protein